MYPCPHEISNSSYFRGPVCKRFAGSIVMRRNRKYTSGIKKFSDTLEIHKQMQICILLLIVNKKEWQWKWIPGLVLGCVARVHSFTVLWFEAVGYSICVHNWKDQHLSCLFFPSNTKDPYLPLILCQFRYTEKVTSGVHASPCQDSHCDVRALPTGLLNRTSTLFISPNLVGQAKSLLPVTMVTASL